MPAPGPPESFVDAAIRSRITDRDSLMRLYAQAEPGAIATREQFANFLVGRGVLTEFQSGKLLAGRWQGLVVGRYALLCPIGRGGMGIVYLARRIGESAGGSTPRLVALKLLAPQRARNEPRTLTRFRREMEIGAKLPAHPALTRVLDSGEADGIHFLALEYAVGPTVKQRVQESGPMTAPEAGRLFADLALGLQQVHAAGYIHRDLKPSNIIATPNGRAKLLDFGFAVRRGEKPPADPAILGGRGYTMGTMDFLPPEQATDAVSVSAETDIYSLGCSLYYALSGAVPFPYGTAREKIRQHRADAATPLGEFDPTIPAGLVKLVEWMMAKRPENRPPSCRVVAEELERFAPPAPVVATRASYDAAWEAEVLTRVEARWRTHRDAAKDTPSAEELPLPEIAAVADSSPRFWLWLVLGFILTVGIGSGFLGAVVYFARNRCAYRPTSNGTVWSAPWPGCRSRWRCRWVTGRCRGANTCCNCTRM